MNKNLYRELRDKQENDVNSFPMMFAFSTQQFNEGMLKLGLTAQDTDKIYSIGGGGYILKTDSLLLSNMMNNHSIEMQNNIDNDLTGDGFIFDMFLYELCNHEYSYTGDISDTLNCLDLTINDINNSKTLLHGFKRARIEACREEEEEA